MIFKNFRYKNNLKGTAANLTSLACFTFTSYTSLLESNVFAQFPDNIPKLNAQVDVLPSSKDLPKVEKSAKGEPVKRLNFDSKEFKEKLEKLKNNPAFAKLDQGNSSGSATSSSKMSQMDKIPHGEELVSLNFPEGIPLGDLIRTVALWTGKNLILSPAHLGSAQISIIIPNPITKEQAYQAFLSALNMSGFTAVESGNLVKILQINAAKNSGIKTYYGANFAPQTDEVINHIIPLTYIEAMMVANQLRPVLGSTQFAAFTATNSLLVTDTGNRIRRLLEIIKLLDTKVNQPQVAMVPLHYIDAKDAATKITEIYNIRGGSPLYLQKVVVNERANSLILVGPARGLDDVVKFITRLDHPTKDTGGQAQIRIRQLDYADAEKLAATLQALAQAGSKQNQQFRSPFLLPPFEQPKSSGGSSSGSSADLGNVKITADKPTNSLIIQGSQAAYNELNNLIKQLDRRRAQIYVETDIVDVNITDGFRWNSSFVGGTTEFNGRATLPFGFSVEKASPFTINSGAAVSARAQAISGAIGSGTALLGILGNKKVSIMGVDISPGAFIFALKNDSNNTVLQTPSILVSDNEQAKFQVVNTFTYVTTAVDPVTKAATGTPQKQEVNTTLNVTPQISQADFINMKIEMQLDNAGPTSSDPQFSGAPTFISKRSASTAVTVQNSQTIVIGGLNYEKEDVSESGVPLLKDIPFLGWLFKSSLRKKEKNNLMVFIRPYVIRNSEDLEKVYTQKIHDRDSFFKAFYGKNYQKEDFYQKLPTLEEGKAPPILTNPDLSSENNNNSNYEQNMRKKIILPSEDPDPISAPPNSGAGGGGGGGGSGYVGVAPSFAPNNLFTNPPPASFGVPQNVPLPAPSLPNMTPPPPSFAPPIGGTGSSNMNGGQ
ncbi:MAG: type II secretion system secretin GspD [Silvanigrellaceae bacterium]|nr:type II secretion system secretin GspD [Silvanigrellaceae bacterium]